MTKLNGVKSKILKLIEATSKSEIGSSLILGLEKIALKIGMNEEVLLSLYVEVANERDERKFLRVKFKDRILLLPHCLRSKECPAPMNEYGYTCLECGRCCIGEIARLARGLGYGGVFIIPGGSALKKIIERYRPKAILGVACLKECVLGHLTCLRENIAAQAVPLSKDGCVNTDVDVKEVFQKVTLIEG